MSSPNIERDPQISSVVDHSYIRREELIDLLHTYIKRYNSLFLECNQGLLSLVYDNVNLEYPVINHPHIIQYVAFSLDLFEGAALQTKVATVSCEIYILKRDKFINEIESRKRQGLGLKRRRLDSSWCMNPEKVGRFRYITVGCVDCQTMEGHENKGYNKLLQTVANYILHNAFLCYFIVSQAVSPKTMHILNDYFNFASSPELRNHMLQQEIDAVANNDAEYRHLTADEKKRLIDGMRRQIKHNLDTDEITQYILVAINELILKYRFRNNEPAPDLTEKDYQFNMITDLTDPHKQKILYIMNDTIKRCICPPCKTKPILIQF